MTLIELLAERICGARRASSRTPTQKGFWTIGGGHRIDKRRGGGISRAAAAFLLQEDIANVMRDLDRFLPGWRELAPVRQRGLAAMAFQRGGPGLRGFRQFLPAVRAGRFPEAADQRRDSAWARPTPARAPWLARAMETAAGPVEVEPDARDRRRRARPRRVRAADHPFPVALALAVPRAAIFGWAGWIDTRLSAVERWIGENRSRVRPLIRLDERIDDLDRWRHPRHDTLKDLNRTLDAPSAGDTHTAPPAAKPKR